MHGDVSRTSPVGSDQEYTRRRFLKTAAWGAAAISAAGIAEGCAKGGEEQGTAGEAKKNAQGDHQGVGGTSVSEARAPIMLSSNPLYDGFGQRGLFHAYYGGADFGQGPATAAGGGGGTSARAWDRGAGARRTFGPQIPTARPTCRYTEGPWIPAWSRRSNAKPTASKRPRRCYLRRSRSWRYRSRAARCPPTSSRSTTRAGRGPRSCRPTATTRPYRRCTSPTRRPRSGAATTSCASTGPGRGAT